MATERRCVTHHRLPSKTPAASFRKYGVVVWGTVLKFCSLLLFSVPFLLISCIHNKKQAESNLTVILSFL